MLVYVRELWSVSNMQLCSSMMFVAIAAVSEVLVQVDDLAWCIMREISKMCYNPVEEDVVRAKNQLKAAILFSQDNLSGAQQNSSMSTCYLIL